MSPLIDDGHKLAGLPPGRRAVRLRQADGMAPQHRVLSRSDPGANGLAAVITARDGVRHSLALDARCLIQEVVLGSRGT